MIRALSRRQLGIDIAVGVLLVVVATGYAAEAGYLTVAGILVALGMGAALTLRRLSPPLALILAWVVAALQMLLRQDPGLVDLAILPVLYSSAVYGPTALRWLGFASTFVGATIATLYSVTVPALLTYATPSLILEDLRMGYNDDILSVVQGTLIVFIGSLAVLLLSWVLGLLARAFSRSEASREAQRVAEEDRILAERAVIVEQERNRIARDMHDIVAHSLAVVIAQADGARYLYAASAIRPTTADQNRNISQTSPDLVDESLSTIAATARTALADVRVLLGELRHNETAGPQPGLAAVDDLLSHFRAAGLGVEYRTSGSPSELGAPRELAVYRIVQEALTNALRHADTGQPALVSLDWGAADVWLTITSTLEAPAAQTPPPQGHGIAGMTERAALAGGTLHAGPRGSLFVVAAQLPIPAAPFPAHSATPATPAATAVIA